MFSFTYDSAINLPTPGLIATYNSVLDEYSSLPTEADRKAARYWMQSASMTLLLRGIKELEADNDGYLSMR